MLDVHCDATADKLVDCSFYYQSVYHFCYDGSTAGVRCQGLLRSSKSLIRDYQIVAQIFFWFANHALS